jgi:hypothetical protein
MVDNTLILDGIYVCVILACTHRLHLTGDEPINQLILEDDLADIEIAVDGDDEEDLFDYGEASGEVSHTIYSVYES